MSARECALRFCAFYLSNWRDYRNNDLDGFLNATMKRINEMTESGRSELKSVFQKAMRASHKVLGDEAFRKRYRLEASRSPVSKALFEVWSVALAGLDEGEISSLARNGKDIQRDFMGMLKDDRDFEVSISYATGVPGRVHKRFSAIEELVGGKI